MQLKYSIEAGSGLAFKCNETIAGRPTPMHGRRLEGQRAQRRLQRRISIICRAIHTYREADTLNIGNVEIAQQLTYSITAFGQDITIRNGRGHSPVMDQGDFGNVIINTGYLELLIKIILRSLVKGKTVVAQFVIDL
ncbi:hypothetical protein D3C72_541850 [compost metagenome]